MKTQRNKATEQVFGSRKLTGADPTAIAPTLAVLGPWGIALLAAYLAGQGLVKLVEKVQALRTVFPIAQAVDFTAEETAQIEQAVKAMELERFAESQPEAIKWIKEHPPVATAPTGIAPIEETQSLARAVETAVSTVSETANEGTCNLLIGLVDKLAKHLARLDDLAQGGHISQEELANARADLQSQQERAFRAIDVYCS